MNHISPPIDLDQKKNNTSSYETQNLGNSTSMEHAINQLRDELSLMVKTDMM